MATREIRKNQDPILRKTSRAIEEITERIKILNEDMIETMKKAEGIGLAAPQVGILKRLFVIDIGEGPITFINPNILEVEGEVEDSEGCLSFPERSAVIKRPERVVIEAIDLEGKAFQFECTGLLARAACHELDHLNGVLFIDHIEK